MGMQVGRGRRALPVICGLGLLKRAHMLGTKLRASTARHALQSFGLSAQTKNTIFFQENKKPCICAFSFLCYNTVIYQVVHNTVSDIRCSNTSITTIVTYPPLTSPVFHPPLQPACLQHRVTSNCLSQCKTNVIIKT